MPADQSAKARFVQKRPFDNKLLAVVVSLKTALCVLGNCISSGDATQVHLATLRLETCTYRPRAYVDAAGAPAGPRVVGHLDRLESRAISPRRGEQIHIPCQQVAPRVKLCTSLASP